MGRAGTQALAAANIGLALAEARRQGRRAGLTREETEDMAGEALAALVKAAGRWDPAGASFSTLATVYARNACRSHMQRRRMKMRTPPGGALLPLHGGLRSPGPDAPGLRIREEERAEARRRLEALLSALPPGEAKAILLRLALGDEEDAVRVAAGMAKRALARAARMARGG